MNEIITCPACQNKVQLPQEFLGRAVQCPECKHTFVAGGVTMPPTSVRADPFVPAPGSPRELEPMATPRRPRYAVDDDVGDEPFDDWGHRQRALRPDRGGMILAFGILALMTGCGIGLIFGLLAWFMGSSDLAAIDAGEMNPSNRGLVQAGRIIGGVGVLMQLLIGVGTVLWLVFVFSAMRH